MHFNNRVAKIRRAAGRVAAVIVLLGLMVAGLRLANFGPAGAALARAAKGGDATTPDTSHDRALKAALQKQFLIPNANDIELGSSKPSPFAGIWERTVTFSNEHGQKATYPIYVDASETRVIVGGRYVDTSDPWQKVDEKSIHLDDRPSLGPAHAPVTIIEFSDLECPFCKRAFGEIETLVNTTYKGRVRLIWKNFPLTNVHPWAEQAAIAAECARRQNPQAFWTFAHDFYHDQEEISIENLRQHIDTYASEAGLDAKALNACVLGQAAPAQVQQDTKDAQALHIESTPTFLINGIPVIGLPSGDVFDFVIRSQLEQSASR